MRHRGLGRTVGVAGVDVGCVVEQSPESRTGRTGDGLVVRTRSGTGDLVSIYRCFISDVSCGRESLLDLSVCELM